MKHFIQYISFLSAVILLLLSACSRDEGEATRTEPYTGERISMNVRFKAGEVVSDDSVIKTARVIVFNDQGQLVYNQVNEAQLQSGLYVATAEAAHGFNNFYVICNETDALKAKLEGVTQEADVETTGFNAVGITVPIPMYAKVQHAYISAKSNGSDAKITINNVTTDYLPVEMTRMLAKISFTAIKNVPAGTDDFLVQELRIRVCHMPVITTIGEGRTYTDTKWSTNVIAIGEGTLDNNGSYTIAGDAYTIPQGVDRVTFPDLYIPEHLLEVASDRSRATYLTVDATCRMKNGSTQVLHSTYQVCIGENPPATFNLRRNNHYRIYATITDIGAMGIFAEIQAMDEFNVAVNWKPVDGLVIVSDKISDYDLTTDTNKNINIWSDYSVYSGILKTYHSDKGFNDISFKYGSLIAVRNDPEATTAVPFTTPVSAADLGDILWYPSNYGNPYNKITDWASIPYVASGNIPVDNSQLAQGLGDPCKLVGLTPEQISSGIDNNGQWHMATPAEYAIWQQTADNETNSYGYKSFHYVMAPNVKTRAADGMLSAAHNGGGQYWTTELSSAFGFVSATPADAGVSTQNPQQGFAVRCVRNVIPNTELSVITSPSFSYKGNTTTGAPFSIFSNIPYWTATLITDTSDPEIGGSREFDDFSFAPGDTHIHSASGSFRQSIQVYVKRKESISSRNYRLRVTGIGFNGVPQTVHVTVSQLGYSLIGVPTFTPEINSINWVPKAGGTYAATINISPTDIAVPAGDLVIIGYYLNVEICRTTPIATSPNQYIYSGQSITIPENRVLNSRGLEFKVFLQNNPAYPEHIGYHYVVQDNK